MERMTHISIHAPRVGGDAIDDVLALFEVLFQSTPPVWGATSAAIASSRRVIFQSTPPVWGATGIGFFEADGGI